MFEKLVSFTKKVADLADRPSLNSSELKSQFDAAPDEVRVFLNKLIDALKSTATGDSGAKNVGATSISGLTGTDVQTLLENLNTKMNDTAVQFQTPTFLNGWVENSPSNPARYWKTKDGMVHFEFAIKDGAAGNNVVVMNFPTGYRPSGAIQMTGFLDNGSKIVVYHVHEAGELKILRDYGVTGLMILNGSFKAVN
jgi:hypothetical protein